MELGSDVGDGWRGVELDVEQSLEVRLNKSQE